MKCEITISDELIARWIAGERPHLIIGEDFHLSAEPAKKGKRLVRGAVDELIVYADLLKSVTQKLQQDWLKAYEITTLILELNKAATWLENATKKPKSIGSFLNNWLSKSGRPAKVAGESQRAWMVFE